MGDGTGGSERADADHRPAHEAARQLDEAGFLAHRQPRARTIARRRHTGYRLRPQAVPPRSLPRPAVLRSHAPLLAGAGQTRGRPRRLGVGEPSAAHSRALELRNARSPRRRLRRPRRRHLAAAPGEGAAYPDKALGSFPPVAQSSSSTVWTMGSFVAAPSWVMQPILP